MFIKSTEQIFPETIRNQIRNSNVLDFRYPADPSTSVACFEPSRLTLNCAAHKTGRPTLRHIIIFKQTSSGMPRIELSLVEAHHMVCFVTGVAGFIGSATAEKMLELGATVVGLDEMNDYYDIRKKYDNLERINSKYKSTSRFIFYKGDFSDEGLVDRIMSEHDVTVVCHLGARAGVRPSIDDPLLYVQSNILGTTVMLQAAAKRKISHFVYASSSSVYGGSTNASFQETEMIVSPFSPYAATKASCELMAATYHHLFQMNVTGLRFFTVFGPNGRPDMAPYKFIDRIYRGEAIDQYGDGTSERDYTFIDDIVDGVISACCTPLGCTVVNLGNGHAVGLKHFIATVEKYIGKKANIRVLPDQPGDVPRTCADISRAQQLLGYCPQTSFDEGIRKTVEWYMTNVATQSPVRQTVV